MFRPLPLLATILAALTLSARSAPVINEIMFHPSGSPVENPAQEWIELFNPGTAAVDISGWKLKGVGFTFPASTAIPAGGYIVVAADVATFNTGHPGFAGLLVGGWTGQLSDNGEQIQLDDAVGNKISSVTYSTEGDWALRGRGALSLGHKGWAWYNDADGGGKTIELRDPLLSLDNGQNWGVSAAAGGSPGAANSVASANIAPLIIGAKHRPELPHSTDPIVISCFVQDEAPGATATLRWRLDGASTFNSLPMSDTNGGGDVEATIPPQANLAIIEWYISVTDGINARTWPAPTRTSDPGVTPETFGQVTNALLQVDNSYDAAATFQTPANSPIYRLILTASERSELVSLQTTNNGQQESTAVFNGTFISQDGAGLKTRYLCGIGNRGQTSALGPPNNYHVAFPADDLWNNWSTIGINCRFPYSQALGAALYTLSGIAEQDTVVIKTRLNGVDLAQTTAQMYGHYVRIEGRGSSFARNHFPNDPNGNFYRLDYHNPGPVNVPPGNLGSGEFRYEGEDPLAYADTYIKENNLDAFDFTDLINFIRIVSAPLTGGTTGQPAISDANYFAAISSVLDLDETYKYFATDSLIGNSEGGLETGGADDASLYRGTIDTRFKFLPHDLDTVFDIGDTVGGVSRSVFSFDGSNSPGNGVLGLTRLFNHPQLVPRYYSALLDALNTWFNNATIDPIVDQLMSGWVPPTDAVSQNRSVADIKAFVAARRTNVLNQIQQNYSLAVTTTSADTPEGYKQTATGAATFSGTFNVAKTYSITVNGVPATLNYRTTSTLTAGTWSLGAPSGGGSVLAPGLNKVVVNFWDAPNGTGHIIQSLGADVVYNSGIETVVNGAIKAGSLRLTTPSSYVPGKPFLARVELLDASGALDRSAWDTTVALSSNVAGMSLPSVQLYNGQGSALVTAGGGTGQADDVIFPLGATWFFLDNGTNQGTAWRAQTFPAEAAAPWKSGAGELGVGDGDEATVLQLTAGATGNPFRTYYFRKHFTLPSPLPAYANIKVHMRCDDGAIVYVNGTQAAITVGMTANMASTALCSFNRTTTSSPNENTYEDYLIPISMFVVGDNTIAVEVHNNADSSPDISFDLALSGVYPSADPGAFTLTASGAGFLAQKTITSLGTAPAYTVATGAIAADTTWSGPVHVTGDVTVNTGVTLTLAAGTNIFVDGDATAGSSAGRRIIVNGTLLSSGTPSNPVNISSFNATDYWGGFSFSNAQPSTLSYTLLSHAGHTTGVGHTSKGPMLRLASTNLSLLDSTVADGPAKAIYASGSCDVTIQRSLIERMITGPELEDGSSLLCEDSNIQRILPDFRESNDALSNDEDCLYIHNGPGRSVIVRRCVFARCGDDVMDNLAGPLVVQDSILREGWDKGLSLLNNNLTISNTQIIHCDKGIAAKSQAADVHTINATNLTVVSENHDSLVAPWGYTGGVNGGDPDTPSTGFYTQNKAGQSNTGATINFNIKNCIVIAQQPILVDSPYPASNTVVSYSDLLLDTGATFTWPGTGNISTDPLFAAPTAGNYHLTAGSPAVDTGDPSMFDPDNSRVDMGALPLVAAVTNGSVTWSPAGGPYHITANTTVPTGLTLIIQPGTHVYFDQNKRLTVNGVININGTAAQHVVFSHVPGTIAAGDCDPIKNGVQTGPPKWGGLRIVDSLATENKVAYVDFINAQGTSPVDTNETDQENWGSLGIIRSWAWVDHCTWVGSHLRWCYGRCAKLTVTGCRFGDMFDATEAPPADFVSGADNKQEPLKVEYKTTDTELTNNPKFNQGFPIGGWFRVYYNDFFGNKGHNDVFDGDGGRVGSTYPLDCRYNYFHGLSGDEHMDLKGDALIANNMVEHATKDQYTSDTGYSNAISTDNVGAGTTVMVAHNTFFDLDHVINCKGSVATIVEHNTIANLHADFHYSAGAPYFIEQDVKCSVVNMMVFNDGATPPHGDGCYLGYNIISGVPRLVSDADTVQTATDTTNHSFTTKIEFNRNLLDQITDPSIGFNHPGTVFSSAYGMNLQGSPSFVNAAAKDYTIKPESPARAAGPAGLDLGANISEWAYIDGGPRGTTNRTSAVFNVGGPGLIAIKWRLDGGSFTQVQIGTGGVFDRTNPTVRTATLSFPTLAPGLHTLEVLGMDFAGNWQDADPAKTYAGQPQAPSTTRTWTVDPASTAVRLSEILADSATLADTVELENLSGGPISLAGWSLTDDPLVPNKVPLSGIITDGGFSIFSNAGLALDKDGDSVYLYQGTTLRDSVTFGQQITDKTIGRNAVGNWVLCTPTFGSANTPTPVGDFSSIKLNEWLASADVLYNSDWVELRNTATIPSALQGLRLTNNRTGNLSAYTFPPLSFLDAGGYLRLIADATTASGHLPYTIDGQYTTLSLINSSGSLLDTVSFYPQTADFSMGRDATGALTFYELPTRGFANGASDPAYANALALIRGLRITEIMFNALGGSEYDYVELRNVGSTPLQLAGVSFVSGITFIFPTMTLSAGQNVLVVKNITKFRSRYGNGPLIAGVFAGQLDNGGEKLALQLPPPFDEDVMSFTYSDTWQSSTDGAGRSLVISNPLLRAGLWNDKDAWTASLTNGGRPNGTPVLPLSLYEDWSQVYGATSLTLDTDGDGIVSLAEFGLGMNPTSPNGGDGAAGAPIPSVSAAGHAQLSFLLPADGSATQGVGYPELTYTVLASSDLANWAPIITKTFTTSWTGGASVTIGQASGAFIPITVEDTTSGAQRFLRLQVTWTP